jgi:hypothetical protein
MTALPLDLRPLLATLPPPRPQLDDTHSPIGPSSAARLFACPASYATSQLLRRDAACMATPVAAAAERGSREHALVETAIGDNVWPEITEEFDGYKMGAAARLAIETVTALVRRATRSEMLLVEEMLDGRCYHELFFGTVDMALLWRDRADQLRLSIVDLKTGSYVVRANALQLKLYAALVLLDPRTRDLARHVWHISTTIVQPHASPMPADGTVRTACFTRADILADTMAYLDVADAATRPDAVEVLARIPGEHCLFCPAKPACPARRARRDAHAALLLSPLSFDADEAAAFEA